MKLLKKVTKAQLALLIFTVLYTLIFGFYYLSKRNYEFLGYVGTLIFFIIVITYLHFKFNFSTGVLMGISIWGLMHMSGGFFIINSAVLYKYQIFSFLRYDQLVHLWGFGFATLFSYYILRTNAKDERRLSFTIFLIFIGMGIGALNEIIEFMAVLIVPDTGVGGYDNTMWDIVFNTFGAILAVIYINVKRRVIGNKIT